LMRRVMKPADFTEWFHRFLPGTAQGNTLTLMQPAIVTDRTDPKLVHLDGLNLSRAWCMRNIANALPLKIRRGLHWRRQPQHMLPPRLLTSRVGITRGNIG